MQNSEQTPDPVQNFPRLHLQPLEFLGSNLVGQCPGCDSVGTFIYTRTHDPHWGYCCTCGLSGSIEYFAGRTDHGNRTPAVLWSIYRATRRAFLEEPLPSGLRMAFNVDRDPRAPRRLLLHNHFLGFCELSELRRALRDRSVKLAASELPERGFALVIPCSICPGLLAGFWCLTDDGESGYLMRAGYDVNKTRFLLKIRPTPTVAHYPSLDVALDQCLDFALFAVNISLTCNPVRECADAGCADAGTLQEPRIEARSPLANWIDVPPGNVYPPTAGGGRMLVDTPDGTRLIGADEWETRQEVGRMRTQSGEST